jgi:phosphoribosylglycinamide formyltransferase-1
VKNIVILISGAGSNMSAIVKAAHEGAWFKLWGVKVAAVISNKPQASGLKWLQEHAEFSNIKTQVLDHTLFESREAFDQSLMAQIDVHVPVVVRLEGTNANEGRALLSDTQFTLYAAIDLNDAAQQVVSLAKGIAK